MRDVDTISGRIQLLVQEFSGGVNSQFAKIIGVNESNIRSYITGTQPKFEVLSTMATKFALNCEWLLTGNGNMLKNDMLSANSNTADAIPFQSKFANMGKPIPLVHQFAAAGFGNTDFSIGEQDVKEYYVIPKFKYSKVDFMIEVTGMSMYPHYTPGDVIACSILHDSQFIQWNKCHVIATQEQGILVKRIKKADNSEHIIAVSDNKEFDPFPVPFNEITGMALVVGSVSIE